MKETFDPNRPYNRTEINKEFDRVKAKMHKKALAKGKAKYNDNRALYRDGYTGEELRGGDAYEYDHARSAEEIFNKYKATHSDKQIAKIVNNRSNIKITKTDINRFKGKYKFEDKLKNVSRAKELGINLFYTKKALKIADFKMSLQAAKLGVGFFQSIAAFFQSIFILIFGFLKIILISFWKFILIAILAILLILLFIKIYNWFGDFQTNDRIETKTEMKKVQNIPINDNELEVITPKTVLNIAKPLEDLTKSVTKISEFDSIVRNLNFIPVIGSMFEYNSSDISTDGKEILTGFAIEHKKLTVPNKVIIEGFTCTIGSTEYNQSLGKKRAKALETELIQLGFDKNIIIIKPIGKQNFVSTNNRNNDLILNRRSNVTIIGTD